MKKAILILPLLLISLSGHADEDALINTIGLDEQGNEIEFPVKRKKYRKRLSQAMKYFNQETYEALEKTMVADNPKFELKQIDVGSYVSLKFKIGSVVKASVEPYFKLYFKR